MKPAVAIVMLLIGLGLLPAAQAADAPAPSPQVLTIYHRWTSASEAAALQGIVELYKVKYPEVTVKTVVIARRSGSAYLTLKMALRAGAPPAPLQIHTGYSVRPFFDANMLTPVDDIWASEKLDRVIPASLDWMRQSDGHYYSIPINVHRNNLVWYNQSLLAKHRIDPATLTTWGKLFAAADTLREGGVAAPFQIAEVWTLAHLFECIMASLGQPAYQDWVTGKLRDVDDARLRDALGIMKQYLSYANKDHETLDWAVALGRVIKGQSAFCVMGDWSDGEFRQAGLRYGVDYGAIAVPGTKTMYGATIDAFHKGRGTGSSVNVDRWLKLIASREGQDVFNRLKGSIPARTDPDVTKYGPYQKWAIAEFKTATAYPSFGAVMPEGYQQALNRLLLAFTKDLDIKKAAEALVVAGANLGETRAGQ